jgi:hypothetical protein
MYHPCLFDWDNTVLFFNLDYFTMINICSVCVFETAHLRWSWLWEKKCSRMKKRRAAMITAVALQQRNTTNIHQRKRRGETASTSIIRCAGKDPPICPWTLWFCWIFLLYLVCGCLRFPLQEHNVELPITKPTKLDFQRRLAKRTHELPHNGAQSVHARLQTCNATVSYIRYHTVSV